MEAIAVISTSNDERTQENPDFLLCRAKKSIISKQPGKKVHHQQARSIDECKCSTHWKAVMCLHATASIAS